MTAKILKPLFYINDQKKGAFNLLKKGASNALVQTFSNKKMKGDKEVLND